MIPRRVFLQSALLSVPSLVVASPWDLLAADKAATPKVEVVFCLDTTGSMGGLIEGAKQKIWSISNQIAGGKPSPDLKIGLVAYRDRSDKYVTRVFDLTDDLDAVYGNLKTFSAAGGGDAPESVNQALNESVNKIKWSTDDKTLRIIFLVGDAPPKMTYKNDVKYSVTCQQACKKEIIINTIQCGANRQTTKYWQEICNLAEGKYVQIAQNGGVQVVATPYDKRLAQINGELAKTTVAFGDERMRRLSEDKAEEAAALPAAPAAARAGFAAKKGRVASYDLIDAIKSGKVKLKDVKKEHLPKELQKMTPAQQEAHLKKLEEKRNGLRKEALGLDQQRSDYIKKKVGEGKGKDGFDNQVLEILRQQAKKKSIQY